MNYRSALNRHHTWMALGRSRIGVHLIRQYLRRKCGDLSVAKPSDDLVVDGYPRSANTLAVAALRVYSAGSLSLAHHIHGPMQFVLARDFGIPALLVIRDPDDAIASLALREEQVILRRAYLDYCLFHESLLFMRSDFVIAPFDDILNRFSTVMEKLNVRFNLNLPSSVDRPGDDARVTRLVEEMDMVDRRLDKPSDFSVGRPSRVRNSKKLQVRERAEIEVPKSLRMRARKVYEAFVG